MEYRQNKAGCLPRSPRIDAENMGKMKRENDRVSQMKWKVAKFAAPPKLEVRFVSCNESAIKRWLSSELEETVFSLSHELFMTKHHTVTLTISLLVMTDLLPKWREVAKGCKCEPYNHYPVHSLALST